jgi:hypothetical protein
MNDIYAPYSPHSRRGFAEPQSQYRTHETAPLRNWKAGYDKYEEMWFVTHYVGGEDGHICIGEYDTEQEAKAARDEANIKGVTHTHIIDL